MVFATYFQMAATASFDYYSYLQSNPKLLAAVVVQIIMGFALGYILAKAFKYIIAFVLVLIAGAVLNIWTISSSPSDFFQKLSFNQTYVQYLIDFSKMLSILLVGPVLVGFILGLIVGWLRK